jgi:hypothetical protein
METPKIPSFLNPKSLNEILGFYLDKLKVKAPAVYFAVQTAVTGLLIVFSADIINISEEVDTFIIIVLGGLSFSSPRTSSYKKAYEEKQEKVELKQDYTIDLDRVKAKAEYAQESIQKVEESAKEKKRPIKNLIKKLKRKPKTQNPE